MQNKSQRLNTERKKINLVQERKKNNCLRLRTARLVNDVTGVEFSNFLHLNEKLSRKKNKNGLETGEGKKTAG